MKAERPVYWAAEACCLGNRRAPAELLRRALERLPSIPSARSPVWFASILESMGDKEAAWRGHPAGRPDGAAARAAVRARFEGAELIRVNSACTSGAAALALAWLSIRQGAYEGAAVVGYEERSAFIEAGFQSLQTRSAGRSRPFARSRDGFRPAAGAAAVWLSARPSDTDVRLAGAAITNDAHHPTGPHPEGDGLRRAIEQCLDIAGATPESIDALKLSGAGTPYSDEAEYKALRAALGSRLAGLPAFVPKARIGHLQGAAGVVETALAVHALRSGRIPSVSAELVRDLQFELNLSAQPRTLALRSVLAVYSGFGGQNVCLLLMRGGGA